jgi:cytochrome c
MQIFRSTLPTPSPHLVIVMLLFVSMLCVAKPAQAENEKLIKLMLANNCFACHQIDKRKYGPNFIEVASKYGRDKSVIATLANKIKNGGTGVWGEDVMPPQSQVSEADATTMAELILSLKPKE